MPRPPEVKPKFEFSAGIGLWTEFSPIDGTSGMRNTGVVAWIDSDVPTWVVGTGTDCLDRVLPVVC